VGDDQVKHIELTRHLAKTFNHKYGDTFTLPQPVTGSHKHRLGFRGGVEKSGVLEHTRQYL